MTVSWLRRMASCTGDVLDERGGERRRRQCPPDGCGVGDLVRAEQVKRAVHSGAVAEKLDVHVDPPRVNLPGAKTGLVRLSGHGRTYAVTTLQRRRRHPLVAVWQLLAARAE